MRGAADSRSWATKVRQKEQTGVVWITGKLAMILSNAPQVAFGTATAT